jgi:hypothetical protein
LRALGLNGLEPEQRLGSLTVGEARGERREASGERRETRDERRETRGEIFSSRQDLSALNECCASGPYEGAARAAKAFDFRSNASVCHCLAAPMAERPLREKGGAGVCACVCS